MGTENIGGGVLCGKEHGPETWAAHNVLGGEREGYQEQEREHPETTHPSLLLLCGGEGEHPHRRGFPRFADNAEGVDPIRAA